MKKTLLALALAATSAPTIAASLSTVVQIDNTQKLECSIYSPNLHKKYVKEKVGDMVLSYQMNDATPYLTAGEYKYDARIYNTKTGVTSIDTIYEEFSQNNFSEWAKEDGNLVAAKNEWSFNVIEIGQNKKHIINMFIQGVNFEPTGESLTYMSGDMTFDDVNKEIQVKSNHYFECGTPQTGEYVRKAFEIATSDLNHKINKMAALINQNEKTINHQHDTIDKLETELLDNVKDVTSLKRQIEWDRIIIKGQADAIKNLENMINELTATITALMESEATTDQEFKEYKNWASNTISWYQRELAATKSELNTIKAKMNEEKRATLEALEKNTVTEVEELTECGSEAAGYEQKCTAVNPTGSGSMGFGLSIIGLLGLVRRFTK